MLCLITLSNAIRPQITDVCANSPSQMDLFAPGQKTHKMQSIFPRIFVQIEFPFAIRMGKSSIVAGEAYSCGVTLISVVKTNDGIIS